MCGRFTLILSLDELLAWFGVNHLSYEYVPRYNAAPGQMITAIIAHQGRKRIGQLKWGLIPSWAENEKIGYKMINARGETVRQKPSFREAFQRRRCLIPADGFYEWDQKGGGKQPLRITLQSQRPFVMAGLYDTWISPSGEKIHSCTIVTTRANSLIATIHERMPVILREQDFDLWLDRENRDTSSLTRLLEPYPGEEMTMYTVTSKVGNAKFEDPSCVAPL